MNGRTAWTWTLAVFILAAFAVTGAAQEVVEPESVGLSSQQLTNIDALIQPYMDEGVISGAVVLVARQGKIAYFEAFGNMDEDKPMTADAIFSIASMSKTVAAVAIMQLVDQGKILLTDPVSLYIPEFQNQVVVVEDEHGEISLVPAEREVTIHDLLTMTSGVGTTQAFGSPVHDFVAKLYVDAGIRDGMDDYDTTLGETIPIVGQLPLLFQPGEEWYYANPGVDTLGYLVEVVSGMPLDAYCAQQIFQPLQMADTGFYPPEEQYGRVPAIYYGHGDKQGQKLERERMIPEIEGSATYSPQLTFGQHKSMFLLSGGIHTTAYDWFRLVQMLLNKGELDGTRVLSKQAVTLMTTNQIKDLPRPDRENDWGYLLDIQEDNTTDMPFDVYYGGTGAFSWNGAYGTHWFANPNEETVIVIMSHVWTVWDIAPACRRIVHVVNRAVLD